MTLTLADVLRQDDFGMELRAGGGRALGADVAGATVLLLGQQPTSEHRALLLLTSGVPGGADADGERLLVAAARRAGAAGIVRAVGVGEQVPEEMLAAAEELGLPLLTAPPGASLRGIKDAVNERVTRSDLQLYQRLLTLQSSLIAAVSAPDSTGSLLRRLGSVVHSTVILYYPDGRLLAATGDGPTDVIWRRIDKDLHERQRFTVGRWQVVASLINGPEDTRRWIVLAKRDTPTSDEIVSPLIATVEQLLDVIALNRRAAANEEALQRADVLVRLVSSSGYERLGWDNVRPYGFVPHAPCYVAAIALPQWSERLLDPDLHAQQLREATQILRGLVANSSAPHLVASTEGVVVLLVQASDTRVVDECVAVLRGRALEASAGIGRKVASLEQIVNSYRDARLALTRALTRPDGKP
ncbi:MAG: PucR family transcriptional regulator ligand-binding domain-containing protein, partial [Pseudonocardia sp.]